MGASSSQVQARCADLLSFHSLFYCLQSCKCKLDAGVSISQSAITFPRCLAHLCKTIVDSIESPDGLNLS